MLQIMKKTAILWGTKLALMSLLPTLCECENVESVSVATRNKRVDVEK